MFIDPMAVMNVRDVHNGFDGGAADAAMRIRMWMIERKLTTIAAARDVGVSQSFISHWIAGRRRSKRVEDYFRQKGLPYFLLTERTSNKRAIALVDTPTNAKTNATSL